MWSLQGEREKEKDNKIGRTGEQIDRQKETERDSERQRPREGQSWTEKEVETDKERLAPRDQMVSRSCAEENCSLGMVLLLVVPNGAPASSYSQGPTKQNRKC